MNADVQVNGGMNTQHPATTTSQQSDKHSDASTTASTDASSQPRDTGTRSDTSTTQQSTDASNHKGDDTSCSDTDTNGQLVDAQDQPQETNSPLSDAKTDVTRQNGEGVNSTSDVKIEISDSRQPGKAENMEEEKKGVDTVVQVNDQKIPLRQGGDPEAKTSTCCPCSRAVVLAAVGVMVMVWLLALALGLGLGLKANARGTGGRMAVGAVAADHTACSELGRDMLLAGGSAVDAAIAALVCVGVRQPHSMGIGGGLFLAVYRKAPLAVDMYDGRQEAPAAASHQTFLNKTFLFGNLSIAVPGEIQTYWEAHQKHGRLPWKQLFLPTIKMAADGHPLSYSTARALRVLKSAFGYSIRDLPELCKIFCKENGEPKDEGDEIKMPALARTLKGIADQGPDYLYSNTSDAARALVADVQDMGGLMTMSDLENYKVVKAPPVSVELGDLTLHTPTAPSGGPVLALISKIIYDLNLTASDLGNSTREAAMWHRVVEAFKFVFADRLHLGDPAFADVAELLEKMASPGHAQKLLEDIDPTRTYDPEHYTNVSGAPWREEGTTHISVIGPDGDAVSATSTINYYFGSLLVSPSTGIILNNEMADFATPDESKPLSPNCIEPGKRPLSSMAPLIVVDKGGNPFLTLGSAGGSTITTVNAQVTARVLWLKQSVEEAIRAKRFHHQLFPNVLQWEHGFSRDVVDKLAGYGHVMKEKTSYLAVVQAVSRDSVTGEVSAFSDPRKQAEARLIYDDEI